MSKNYYGSLSVEKMFAGKIATGKNGKHYVCLEDLTGKPYYKGKEETKINISLWINDEPDKFGNEASISLQKASKEEKTVYLGNLRPSGSENAPTTTTTAPSQSEARPPEDLPF